MGWTSTTATHYTESGKIDRKAECDNLYTWETEKRKNDVIKSLMKGNIYYAAVRTTDKDTGNTEVWAAVCLTSTKRNGGFNFGYKSMSESEGPLEDNCPKSILDLLTGTARKYAKEWRERCWNNIRNKKSEAKSLASVKIGEIIEFECGGETIRAEKMAPAYQFKTPWFKIVGGFEYIAKARIRNWRIASEGPATATETPRISAETAEAVNNTTKGTTAGETTHNNYGEQQPPRNALQSPETSQVDNYATPLPERAQVARNRLN